MSHPKIFETPSSIINALTFVDQLKNAPNAICIAPGAMHWQIFDTCIRQIEAKVNDIPDAYHAALEWSYEWVTMDSVLRG
ncbi:MAG: hypothetical protein L3J59_13850 [Methylococcaceae bacterium]|nr:hypothetical protein [Methylococcaceae bacterium]